MKIRVVATGSGAKAVQVVRYHNNKRVILQHLGSAHNPTALADLMLLAEEWIKSYSEQLSIFPEENPNSLLHINHCTFIGVKYHFFHEQINAIQGQLGLDDLPTTAQRPGNDADI